MYIGHRTCAALPRFTYRVLCYTISATVHLRSTCADSVFRRPYLQAPLPEGAYTEGKGIPSLQREGYTFTLGKSRRPTPKVKVYLLLLLSHSVWCCLCSGSRSLLRRPRCSSSSFFAVSTARSHSELLRVADARHTARARSRLHVMRWCSYLALGLSAHRSCSHVVQLYKAVFAPMLTC